MIRTFRLSDIFLVQRLAGQATKLNAAQALLFPTASTRTALSAVIPWGDTRISTYILQQQGHQLARAGFMQVQRRAGDGEADLLLLAPALDTPSGHPAIWEKLLSHYIQEEATDLARIYCDVPDQPLLVNTFRHVGFIPYSRETIWRRTRWEALPAPTGENAFTLRKLAPQDEWAVNQLYARMTPEAMRRAEGFTDDEGAQAPMLRYRRAGTTHTFVAEARGEVTGCLQIRMGKRGILLQLYADMLNPDQQLMRSMVQEALTAVRESGLRLPVYIGVNEHHGGLSALLTDFGFAPFTDRAKLVKHVVQWIREPVRAMTPALESVTEAVPTNFISTNLTMNPTSLNDPLGNAPVPEKQRAVPKSDSSLLAGSASFAARIRQARGRALPPTKAVSRSGKTSRKIRRAGT